MTTYPTLLKEWRKRRRLSQLDLALEADVSARHISFLETGRSQPSPDMIVHLSEILSLPVEAQNQMMRAVGFVPRCRATDLSDESMAPIREAVRWTLDRHAPYPGIALSRRWEVVQMNAPAAALFAPFGITVGQSLLDMLKDPRLPQVIENWPQVAHATKLRLRAESAAGGGVPELDAAAALLSTVAEPSMDITGPAIPAIYRFGAERLSLFGTIAQFSTVTDEALDDLKVELFFPADDQSAEFLRKLAP